MISLVLTALLLSDPQMEFADAAAGAAEEGVPVALPHDLFSNLPPIAVNTVAVETTAVLENGSFPFPTPNTPAPFGQPVFESEPIDVSSWRELGLRFQAELVIDGDDGAALRCGFRERFTDLADEPPIFQPALSFLDDENVAIFENTPDGWSTPLIGYEPTTQFVSVACVLGANPDPLVVELNRVLVVKRR